jgi:hypothetical protein
VAGYQGEVLDRVLFFRQEGSPRVAIHDIPQNQTVDTCTTARVEECCACVKSHAFSFFLGSFNSCLSESQFFEATAGRDVS